MAYVIYVPVARTLHCIYTEMETISQIRNIHYVHITATFFSYLSAAIIRLYRITGKVTPTTGRKGPRGFWVD
jgi:hypothetical protein